ncbi:MAG TPA: type II secretion system protein [Candidatus Paceibacterota bacterium]|nr:type II secretion system protein [Candidatus Paceibacterota bacterium]HRZ34442.1 type II secretion system protein [Candidatus Paceibacterota bacterium]
MKLLSKKGAYRTGFTLLELIIVIAIISVLYSIVILILNPAQSIAKAYDSQRLSDMNALNKAVQQYYLDKQNYLDLGITATETEICDTGYIEGAKTPGVCENLVDLSALVPSFIVAIPTDPLNLLSQSKDTAEELSGNGYTIKIDPGHKIVLRSINLTSNNSPTSLFNNLRIIDIKYQIALLVSGILICLTLVVYFILKSYKR